MIFGDLGGLELPDICPTGEEKPEKTSPRKLVPSRDRTRACCMTGVHAATWPTVVDGDTAVDPGGPVVITLAVGSEVRGFKPGWGRWIFSECKNPEYDFLWKGSKAVDPVS